MSEAEGKDGYAQMPLAEDGVGHTFTESDEVDHLHIAISADAYDAVVAAAFGGIRICLPATPSGRNQYIKGTMPNYSEEINHPKGKMMVAVKLIMITVLQLTALKEILGALKPLCLLINPVTWLELSRPSRDGMGCLFDSRICIPICVAAQLMQFGIAYYILACSISVIVTSESVPDVIFNSLVVTFLGDIDEYAWSAMAAVCHLDEEFFTNFAFEIADDPEVDDKRDQARGTWRIWLFRGKGGKVVLTESLVIFSFLILMYIRQLFMVIQCLDTSILPVARDVCALYRGMVDPVGSWHDSWALWLTDWVTIIDYRSMLTHIIEDQQMEDECNSAVYKDGPLSHTIHYMSWMPHLAIGGTVYIIVMFTLPQLLFTNYTKVLKCITASDQLARTKSGASLS